MATSYFDFPNPSQYGLGHHLKDMPDLGLTDCNDMVMTGWYDVPSTVSNRPSGITAAYQGVLYVVSRGPAYTYQEYYAYYDKKVFRRWKNESGWSAWVQI